MDITHIALISILYTPIQLNIHEGSHAIMAMYNGYDIIAYKPYPSICEKELYFGYIEYDGPQNNKSISMAPYMYNSLSFFVGNQLMQNKTGWHKEIIFTAMMLWPLTDTTYNFVRKNDFVKMSPKEMIMIGSAIGLSWFKLLYTLLGE